MDPQGGNHDDLMSRHRNRRDTNFVPYHERRSEGRLQYTDLGSKVRLEIEVNGLGTLVLIAEAKYCEYLKHYRWTEKAELRGAIDDPASSLPDSLLRQVV